MSSADLVIGVDCSTTASKAVVWDRAGRALATGRRTYGLNHVRSGWVEQHAPDWWTATSAAIADAGAQVGSGRISGIAITHQRETFVCLDADAAPIRPAITWMDIRATAYRTMGGPIPGSYILETFIGGGTQNIVWFIEQLAGLDKDKSPEKILEAAASRIPLGADGLLCLPYWTGAMTPYWDGHARGAFVGLSGLHGKAHMYRAILEGIALEQRLLTAGVEAATGTAIDEILMLGGGSRSPLWCQIIADVLGRPIKLVREQESTALGAGIHAAAALGLYTDILAAAEAMTGIERAYQPDASAHARYTDIFAAYRSLYPNLKTSFQLIAETAR